MDGNNKVIVGLSGGVDSAVAAYLLKKKGYDVIGVNLCQVTKTNCGLSDNSLAIKNMKLAQRDARKVAQLLEIKYLEKDCSDSFNCVKGYFVKSYNLGRTPNPCVLCNLKVKWKTLLDLADELGAYYVATGHYARVIQRENARYTVKQGVSQDKDQAYELSYLTQEQLVRALMPLGEYDKCQIREIAANIGLEIAAKKDSQDICFIPDGKYANYIRMYTGQRAIPGNIKDEKGTIIGRHKGIIFYTVGQSRGLGIDLGTKVYVKK